MLKRHFLQSDEVKAVLTSLPEHIRWSSERIANSLRDTLSERPVVGDVWLFCYGSLIGIRSCSSSNDRPEVRPGQ